MDFRLRLLTRQVMSPKRQDAPISTIDTFKFSCPGSPIDYFDTPPTVSMLILTVLTAYYNLDRNTIKEKKLKASNST